MCYFCTTCTHTYFLHYYTYFNWYLLVRVDSKWCFLFLIACCFWKSFVRVGNDNWFCFLHGFLRDGFLRDGILFLFGVVFRRLLFHVVQSILTTAISFSSISSFASILCLCLLRWTLAGFHRWCFWLFSNEAPSLICPDDVTLTSAFTIVFVCTDATG